MYVLLQAVINHSPKDPRTLLAGFGSTRKRAGGVAGAGARLHTVDGQNPALPIIRNIP